MRNTDLHEYILEQARAHGFSAGFFLPASDLSEAWGRLYRERPPHTQNLIDNPKKALPDASCLFLLVKPYAPVTGHADFPAYYLASNAGYHAANALCHVLQGAQHVEVPLPALVTEARIGLLLKNALIALPGFGTRTALFTLALKGCAPLSYPPHALPACGSCAACVHACPVGAIDVKNGLQAGKCLRAHMENASMPAWVMEHMPGLLGCERCLNACPRNAGVGQVFPDAAALDALDLLRLVQGDVRDARTPVGKNLCGRGRLSAQAAVLLAKQGRTDARPAIEALLSHKETPVREAAQWALKKLMDTT